MWRLSNKEELKDKEVEIKQNFVERKDIISCTVRNAEFFIWNETNTVNGYLQNKEFNAFVNYWVDMKE